jgi:alpha-tubulin suppressor-like RCC1 family protein
MMAESFSTKTALSLLAKSAGASALAAGYYHTCALLVDGCVYCWGNTYGMGIQIYSANNGYGES